MQYSICSLKLRIASMLAPLGGSEVCFRASAFGFLVSLSVVQLFYCHENSKITAKCMHEVDRIGLRAVLPGSLTHAPLYPPPVMQDTVLVQCSRVLPEKLLSGSLKQSSWVFCACLAAKERLPAPWTSHRCTLRNPNIFLDCLEIF